MQTSSDIVYRINKNDLIVFVNDAWGSFALENDAPEITAEKILYRSLWDFIDDETTRQLYKGILHAVRGGKFLQFNFNCDSASEIRLMEMTVSAEKDDGVQFQTRILQAKGRTEQKILNRNTQRTDELILICSWCKAIDIGNQEWKVLDEAISMLELFKQNKLPELSHGMCQSCYELIAKKMIAKRKP